MTGLMLLLLSAAIPDALAVPSASTFTARYVGFAEGAGQGCVVVDGAPRDRYTVYLEVGQPGHTPLQPGQRLCVVVSSPVLYQRLVLETEEAPCQLDPASPLGAWRFACGRSATAPGPETMVVDADYLAQAQAEEQSRLSRLIDQQRAGLEALLWRISALSRCPDAQAARVSEVATMLWQDLTLDVETDSLAHSQERAVALRSMDSLVAGLEASCAASPDR